MGRYKYLLLAYTIVACYYAFTISTVLFTWYLPENGFLFISTVNIFPRWIQQLQIVSFIGCYITSLVIIDWYFIYRLNIIDGSSTKAANLRYSVVVLFGTAFILVTTVVCGVLMASLPKTNALFQQEVFLFLDVDLEQMAYVGGQLIIGGQFNVGILAAVVIVGIFVSISFSISIICWRRIGSKLTQLQHVPDSSYRLRRKSYLLLLLQTCVPIMFNMLPAGVIIILCFFKVPYSDVSYYCAMVLSFAQILDPLFTIFFISEYKRFLQRTTKRLFCGSRIGVENRITIQTSSSNQQITNTANI